VGESEITFALPAAARVELRVYDVRGRLVRTLVNEARAEGVHHEGWNGRDEKGRPVASGVYLVRFRAAGVTHTERLLRLR
jgi:flagellar hook assembly protein FlgD